MTYDGPLWAVSYFPLDFLLEVGDEPASIGMHNAKPSKRHALL